MKEQLKAALSDSPEYHETLQCGPAPLKRVSRSTTASPSMSAFSTGRAPIALAARQLGRELAP